MNRITSQRIFSLAFRPQFSFCQKVKKTAEQQKAKPILPKHAPHIKPVLHRNDNTFAENYKAGFTRQEMENANDMVKRALSLENCSPGEILNYFKDIAVKKFQKLPNDTGSAAVQVACMSEQIIHNLQFVVKNRHDKKAIRKTEELIFKRRRMLNYLARTDPLYYKWVVAEYNIPKELPKYANHKYHRHGRTQVT